MDTNDVLEREKRAPTHGHLVCGGRFHDFDFARLRLLTLLAEDEDVRVTVSSDYSDLDGIDGADFLISYTCDVRPTPDQQQVLHDFVDHRRWLALHGTNALFDVGPEGAVPRDDAPWLMEVLGSRLLAHPPIHPYTVRTAEPEHPLVAGIEPFETNDELYLCEVSPAARVLLHTAFQGRAPGWPQEDWTGTGPHPVAYLYGNVYYLTLGHCRGHHDLRPLASWYPYVERGSWSLPAFEDLLRRGVAWVAGHETDRESH